MRVYLTKSAVSLLVIFSGYLLGQNNRSAGTQDIEGKILDWKSGETLAYANIVLIGKNQGTAASNTGHFILVDAPVGVCSLFVSYIGYESKIVALTNRLGAPLDITVKLKSQSVLGDEVTITAQTYDIWESKEDISHVSISPRELGSLPTVGEVDIFRSLKLLPGVSSVGDGKAGLFIRGGTPDQNLVILDGMTVYHVDHFFGMFSAFNADAIKDIQVYKGGFPAKYGGRLSSVLDLTGKTGGEYQSYSVGINLISANTTYQTPLWNNRGNFLLSLRRSYTDFIQSPTYNSIYEYVTGEEVVTGSTPQAGGGFTGGPGGGRGAFQQQVVPSFYYYDLNSKLTLNLTDRNFVNFSIYSGKDYLDKSRELDLAGRGFSTGDGQEFDTRVDENTTEWGNIGASVRYGQQWGTRGYSTVMISNSIFESNYDRSLSVSGANVIGIDDSTGSSRGLGGFAEDEFNAIRDLTLRVDNEWDLSRAHKVDFGLYMSDVGTEYTSSVRDTIEILGISTQSRTTSLYAQDRWKVASFFNLTLGLRSSYHNLTNAVYHAPRASFNWHLTDKLQLKGAWGHYYQFINTITNEKILEGSKEFWLSADENIRPGFSEHFIGGLSYNTLNYLFEIEAYYKTLDNLVEFSRRFQNDANYLNYFFFGSGESKGIDFLAQKKHGRMTGWLSYTLARTEYQFPTLNENVAFLANHDRRHDFKAVGIYKRGSWTFSSTFVYTTGNPYTAPESQYTLEMLDGQSLNYIHVGEKNAYRLPDYQRLDLSVSRKFETRNFDRNFDWDFGFSLYNALNHDNIAYREYDLDVTPIIVSDFKMLSIMPTLFIKFKLDRN